MKTFLPFLFLFLCLFAFSCKDDEVASLRISKASQTFSGRSDFYNYTFHYDDKGQLLTYKVASNTAYNNQTTLLYDEKGRVLSHYFDDQHGKWNNKLVELSYDENGRLSSSVISFPNANPEYYAPVHHTYYYDGKGRMSRTDSKTSSSSTISASTYEYDAAGNIIRRNDHYVLPSGELSGLTGYITVTYDTKKNPLYKLGSPLLTAYGNTPILGLAGPILYLSPNNPILREDHTYGGIVRRYGKEYEYNENGYPKQVKEGLMTMDLEYIVR